MIDHLLRFNDEAAAVAGIGGHIVGGSPLHAPASSEAPAAWRGDITIPGTRVYVVTGTETVSEPENSDSERELTKDMDGFWIRIVLPGVDPVLFDLAAFVFDRDAAAKGGKLLLKSSVSAEDFAALHFSPDHAGSRVPDRLAERPAKEATTKEQGDWSKSIATAADRFGAVKLTEKEAVPEKG